MNLTKLFETQRELDAKILLQKGLVGQDLLDKKILALQVELGELANELPEEFKFWANKKNNYERALKEYVDFLHFMLSIGLEKGFTELHITHSTVRESFGRNQPMIIRFNNLFYFTSRLYEQTTFYWYDTVFEAFLALGFELGFTWEQIEQAYYEKNEINHERQANGY